MEEAILSKPEFRDAANRQMVQDLRRLRDAAFILWSYGRAEECEQLLVISARSSLSPRWAAWAAATRTRWSNRWQPDKPAEQRGGGIVGNRSNPNAGPLTKMADMVPLMRADEIIGAEVRTSDDQIIGEVRDIVLGSDGKRDYAIVASGGFFVPGKESIVVSLRHLRGVAGALQLLCCAHRDDLAGVPRMPNNNYGWLGDETWLALNNRRFSVEPKQDR